ncbi:PAS domain-containing sensor histidine kinase [Sphingosinicella sp. LY1275]|uniref:PAS domain-containing sensor histidine kinase n=1 Tax=Sphingosinicella sp. LY1275 TaxID=3095379 RepID=UPI002ADEB342|nr:ATP-binding protein [Sphingosinicella sp. LY1275]MEA1015397.1 ATP-binding protein [Sphingosinicella sp. LY1275]
MDTNVPTRTGSVSMTMAKRIAAFDWSATPLGPREHWPSTLRTVVQVMLGSRMPMYVAWGPELTFLYNDAFAPIIGANHAVSLGQNMSILWADEWPRIAPYAEQALAGIGTWAEDFPFLTWESGYSRTGYFTFGYTPLREGDAVAGLLCTCLDTTAKVHDHRRAEQQRHKLKAMFWKAPGFVFLTEGPEHRFEFVNEMFLAMTGRTAVEGESMIEAFPESEQEGMLAVFDEVYRTGRPFVRSALPIRIRQGADGPLGQFHLEVAFQPHRDADGMITGLFCCGYDVSDRQRALAEAEETRERYALAARATNDIIWDWDLAADDIRWNEALDGFREGEEDEPPTSSHTSLGWWSGHLHPDDRDRVLGSVKAALVGDATHWSGEYRLRRGNGEYAVVYDRGYLIRDEAGKATRFVGAITDLTAMRSAEHQVRQLQAELIHISRVSAMGAMASTLAHELNQPLTAAANYLSGAARLIQSPAAERDLMIEAVHHAQDNITRAGEVIRRLRRLTARGEVQTAPVRLVEAVAEALSLGLMGPEGFAVAVRQEIPDALVVEADSVQLQQVLLNLIRNALEAMVGAPRRKLLIEAEAQGDSAQICVSDTGPGIPADERAILFDPFHTTKASGMGVGLSISRTIVEAHRGRIWAEQAEGGGARICFTLPLA